MKKNIILLLLVATTLVSCSEDWFNTSASDQIPAEEAFNTTKDGRNAINGIFSTFQDENMYGADLITYGSVKGTDVRTADVGSRTENAYTFEETTDANSTNLWSWPYNIIMNINYMIAAEDNMVSDGTEADENYKN